MDEESSTPDLTRPSKELPPGLPIPIISSKIFSSRALRAIEPPIRVIKNKLIQAGDLEFGKKGNLDYGKIGTYFFPNTLNH